MSGPHKSGYGVGMTMSGSSGEVSGELLQIGKLLPQIDRRPHHRVELIHHDAGRVRSQGFVVALDVASQRAHQLQIVEHACTSAGVDHLHHHSGAVGQRRAMGLRN
jgi:hypothetical protein